MIVSDNCTELASNAVLQVEARRAIKRAARVTTTMPTMTHSPSVCGSVLYDSYVNDPAQQPMVWHPDRIDFHQRFFVLIWLGLAAVLIRVSTSKICLPSDLRGAIQRATCS